MKQIFKLVDGVFDFSDSIVVEDSEEVEGYDLPDADKSYKDDGTEMTDAEVDEIRNAPVPISEIAQIRKEQTDLIFELMMAGVL